MVSDIEKYLPSISERIDQFSRFLEPTIPPGQLDYYNPRKPLIGKELSVANIDRRDLPAYLFVEEAILEFLEAGQIGLARFLMITFQAELKLTMSIDGRFMDFIGKTKLEYEHKQHIIEHPVERKRGWFGKRKAEEDVS